MGRDLTCSLEVVTGRIEDFEEDVRNKIDDMAEWAAFKVMRSKIMEVVDKVCPDKTADEVKELVDAAKLAVDTTAITEEFPAEWISRALGEVRDPPPEEDAAAAAPTRPDPCYDSSSDSSRNPYACISGRHCASCGCSCVSSHSSSDSDKD
jgi:hypothetical protein